MDSRKMALVHILVCHILINFEMLCLYPGFWISLVQLAMNKWTWTPACFQKGLSWLFMERMASSHQSPTLYQVQ